MSSAYPTTNAIVARLFRWTQTHWWLSAPAVFAVLEAMLYFPIRPTREIRPDQGLFFLGGNLLATGSAPYLNLWDIKPPLIFETTALITFIAPGEPWTQFYIGSALTMLAALSVVCLSGLVTLRVTGSASAAFVTTATIIGYRVFVTAPAYGIYPKFFALGFGVGALWLSLDNRSVLAAGLATVAAGYWQWALLFVVIVYGRAWRTPGETGWLRMLLASAFVVVVATAPFVLAGATVPMVVEVVIAPFTGVAEAPQPLTGRIHKFTTLMGFLWPLAAAGAVGAFETAYRERDHYWLVVGVVWPAIQLGFVDFDAGPDPLLLLVLSAIALGVTVGTLRLSRHQQLVVVCVVALLVGGQLYDRRETLATPSEIEGPAASADTSLSAFLHQQLSPTDCLQSVADDWSHPRHPPGSKYCPQRPVG